VAAGAKRPGIPARFLGLLWKVENFYLPAAPFAPTPPWEP
jgi:hypothetical protein